MPASEIASKRQLIKSFSISSLIDSAPGIYSLLPAVLLFTMLPLLLTISPFISVFIFAVLFWSFLHSLGRVHLPGRIMRFFLVLIALFLLISQYGFIFSQKASLALFCLMLTLKFLEIKNELDRRNIFLILFLGFFIIITHFLNSQNFLLSLYALINTFILCLILVAFNRKPQDSLPISGNLKLVSGIFIKALPFAIVLFLFFPRIPGPLWSLPEDGQINKTGISDKMFPGSVSELVDSNEIAFRVDFISPVPSSDKLYWRGPVLTQTDGFLWTQKKQQPLIKPLNNILTEMSDPVQYTITLEPTHQKWLFALEMPVDISGDTINGYFISNDLQVINKNNINQLIQYRLTSMAIFKLQAISPAELKAALKFPDNNPETLALGKQWSEQFNNKEQIVLQALNYYRDQAFFYTKKPDIMVDNPADEFLFDKRRGFCEHYASSFVLLMRAAGIPARVVTGYQGIEKNEVGNYYIVRQSNAHAWAEVWIKNKGWQRVDPTAMIPPSRIEQDIFDTNLDRLNYSSLNIPDLPRLTARQKTELYNLGRYLSQTLDNLKHSWNKWILGYDKTQQQLFLKFMGLSANWQTLIVLLISSIGIIALIIYFLFRFQNRKPTDPVIISYKKFIQKLIKSGMTILPSEGPESIYKRALIKFPEHSNELNTIFNLYLRIRYGNQELRELLEDFQIAVKRLRLGHYTDKIKTD